MAQEGLSLLMRQQVQAALLDRGAGGERAARHHHHHLVHALQIPRSLLVVGGAKLSLIKATRHCVDRPALVLAVDESGFVVARCTVPQVTHRFLLLLLLNNSLPACLLRKGNEEINFLALYFSPEICDV